MGPVYFDRWELVTSHANKAADLADWEVITRHPPAVKLVTKDSFGEA